jgi:hypothetical protein
MRWNLSRIQEGEGNVRINNMRVVHSLLAIALLTPIPLLAESAFQQPTQSSEPTPSSTLPISQGKSLRAKVNELADLSRAGNADATTELTRQMFRTNGIPSDIADSFGFTDRIVKSEAAYRNGTHASVYEADIVKAINNLASTFGAPAWAHTNQVEVRKVRMRLLVTYPRLFASQEPPDDKGHYKALSENMRPVEAAYLALCLLYQKHYNADFQFTDEEQAENAKLDATTVKAKHLQRIQFFDSMLRGQTSSASMRDLLTASDHFFDDLGIEQIANIGTAEPTTSSRTAVQKGAR